MADNHQRYYRLLTRKMVLPVVLVSMAPLLLIGFVLLNQFQTAYRSKVIDHLGELIEKHSQGIDVFLTDRLSDIRVVARSRSLADLSDEAILRWQLALLREEYGGVFVDLGLVDSSGVQIAYAGPFNLTGADYSAAGWFKKAMASEHIVSDVFTGLRGAPHFIVAVRKSIHDRDWILRATIDFEAFNALVSRISIGRTGLAFILNRNGEFQTVPRLDVAVAGSHFLKAIREGADQSKVEIVEAKDSQGVRSIYAVSGLNKGRWVLCYQQESGDAFALFIQARTLAVAILIIGGVAIVIVAYIMSHRMVDRIVRADKEKAMMNETVVEAGRLASIGELAAGIAHEINNPVAIMVEEAGWINDLLEDGRTGEAETVAELERATAQIRTQGHRCKEITHKLLSFARKTDPEVREVDLNNLLGEVVDLLAQKARYANVNMVSDLAPELPRVTGSPAELQQVILNLVNNALDAVDSEGGSVELTTRLTNGAAVLKVADSGEGIPEANLVRIFDPFFTTKPVGQGTGLGLSICLGIVHKLGGELTVDSVIGRGTVFTVRLPVATDESSGGLVSSQGEPPAAA